MTKRGYKQKKKTFCLNFICVCVVVFRLHSDPDEQALAPRFLSTAANINCTEGDQVAEWIGFF